MRNLWDQGDVLSLVQATPKPAQATGTPGFLPGADKGPSGLRLGSVYLRAGRNTHLHVLILVGCHGVWLWGPHSYVQCVGSRTGRRGWAASWLCWHCPLQVQNTQESKNSKFKNGFSSVKELHLSRQESRAFYLALD